MPLTPEQVTHIALLSRVGLDDSDIEQFSEQLSEILDYFERLRRVDTEELPPTAHTLELQNVMRADETAPCLEQEEVLRNAPLREGDFFRVRAILEE